MERILLVEPDYANKYPPIGLMKIATYHKDKGDHVEFYKGKAPYITISRADRVYITSLFTFHFDITAETIKHYLNYKHGDSVFLGGIAATLMPERFREQTGISRIVARQLVDSAMLGYDDDQNIDALPLDYDILDDISYEYPAGDNFFAYATRGCPRECSFCAVKNLEPEFEDTNHLIRQIKHIRETFGDKRHILLMDNNVLYSSKLEGIVQDLQQLGFCRETPSYVPPNRFDLMLGKIQRRAQSGYTTGGLLERLVGYLEGFQRRFRAETTLSEFRRVIADLRTSEDTLGVLHTHAEYLRDVVEKHRQKKPLQRYVDFNQGVDARLLTAEKMESISKLPLRPFRLAYDSLAHTEAYVEAFRTAYRHGVRHFSNYLLYNFEEGPEDLWHRLYKNIELYNSLPDIVAFSFPMKYAPIDRIDRDHVGEHWNRKYLTSMNVILNVTKGVVAKEEDFFFKAYGTTPQEFLEILAMPNELVKHRFFFEERGFVQAWTEEYRGLPASAKEELLGVLSKPRDAWSTSPGLEAILWFYRITKYQVESGRVGLSDRPGETGYVAEPQLLLEV